MSGIFQVQYSQNKNTCFANTMNEYITTFEFVKK